MTLSHPHLPPSPALIRLLKSFLNPSEVAKVLEAYEATGKRVGGDLFNRGDASFNPRVCRVLQILIEECKITAPSEVITFIEELVSDPVVPQGDPLQGTALQYADILDRVRHAHFHLTGSDISVLVAFANKLPSDKFPNVRGKIQHMISKRDKNHSL
jgi:hypothetical protein